MSRGSHSQSSAPADGGDGSNANEVCRIGCDPADLTLSLREVNSGRYAKPMTTGHVTEATLPRCVYGDKH